MGMMEKEEVEEETVMEEEEVVVVERDRVPAFPPLYPPWHYHQHSATTSGQRVPTHHKMPASQSTNQPASCSTHTITTTTTTSLPRESGWTRMTDVVVFVAEGQSRATSTTPRISVI
ncbi:hypothetical protein Pcinc_040479 [Petrolisthes cinctipes]|uniref:Uncharacterized protein n=1 Tax=Petrolisthes cinctipes TaxID=88211 RepID=A0AAE1BLT7_PETCI|nr:hypothetical protein Pcinc_040479 [Petrolisthes cinctipes]